MCILCNDTVKTISNAQTVSACGICNNLQFPGSSYFRNCIDFMSILLIFVLNVLGIISFYIMWYRPPKKINNDIDAIYIRWTFLAWAQKKPKWESDQQTKKSVRNTKSLQKNQGSRHQCSQGYAVIRAKAKTARAAATNLLYFLLTDLAETTLL